MIMADSLKPSGLRSTICCQQMPKRFQKTGIHFADQLISGADRGALLMLCPLLARLGESPTRKR